MHWATLRAMCGDGYFCFAASRLGACASAGLRTFTMKEKGMGNFELRFPGILIGAMAGVCLVAALHSFPVRAQSATPAPANAPGTPKGVETKPQKLPEARQAGRADGSTTPPTVGETLTHVGEIAYEVKLLEKRLHALEQSVTALNASLAPVGAALKPEALREIINQAGDAAHSRAQLLILLAAACAAGLLILHAVLRRWSRAPRQPGGTAGP
jgi:hypothetical protein